jgi:UDP:flavonoid glycosyltransferase YjiC (YdhE family)
MGKRIIIATFGSLGDIHPYLALSSGLEQRGHEPIIATSECYGSIIEDAGIGFHAVRPDIHPEDIRLAPQILDPRTGPEFLIRNVMLPYLKESYSDLWDATEGADLLLTHPITYAGPIVAEKRGLRRFSTILSPMSFFSAHDLPVFPGFPKLAELRRLGPGACRYLLRFARWVTREWSRPVEDLRKEVGLPAGGNPFYEGQFSTELNLALFSKVLAKPQPDWPPNTLVTGYPFYEETKTSLAPEIERFLSFGPPPIIFTLGSSAVMAPGGFYQESVKAAKALGKRALLLVGKDSRDGLGDLPDGIMAFDYAPYSRIFPRAAAIVHQGGIGTTGEALRSGRPMLVVPFAFDQPDNGFRVSRLGVARTLYPSRYTATRASEHLDILLSDPSYAARAFQVSREVLSEDGVKAACDAIEERLLA